MENKIKKLIKEEVIKFLIENIDWGRSYEFYETGDYVKISKPYGTIEFGLEQLSDGEEALFIDDISISPQHQGKGYGTDILKSAIKYSEENDIPIALRASVGGHYDTKTNFTQEELIKFYSKFGFETRPDLSSFGGDEIFMVRNI